MLVYQRVGNITLHELGISFSTNRCKGRHKVLNTGQIKMGALIREIYVYPDAYSHFYIHD